jgi:predicted negative regulator of RcsB-dependent stress response
MKIALIAVVLIALGVYVGLEMWSKHQQEVKAAQVQELMRQLIGSPKEYQTPPQQPHTPWSPQGW